MFFEIDLIPLILTLLFFILFLSFYLKRKQETPSVFFSDLSTLIPNKTTRLRFAYLPHQLMQAAFLLFLLAFIDPRFQVKKSGNADQLPEEGIAIYLVLDQSSSMGTAVTTTGEKGRLVTIPKIDLLKQITEQFVKERKNDLIGLVSFARTAKVLAPLTLDHQSILKTLKQLQVVTDKNQDGTAIGYAIFKTASTIAATRHYAEDLSRSSQPAYEIKNSILILVTDGFHSPNPADKDNPLRTIELLQAAEEAKKDKVKVYIINIEPALATKEFTPHRNMMQRIAELTGGKFFMMDNSTSLQQIFQEIDQLEKSILPTAENLSRDQQPHLYQRISLYPYLIGLGMALIFASVLLDTTWLRRSL